MKKLYRSEDNKVIFGILGGLGEFFEMDPTVIRLMFLFFIFITGLFPGVIFYFFALLIVPERPGSHNGGHKKTVENQTH